MIDEFKYLMKKKQEKMFKRGNISITEFNL